jgi:hypothetical protein
MHGMPRKPYSGLSCIGITSSSGSVCFSAPGSLVRNAAMEGSIDALQPSSRRPACRRKCVWRRGQRPRKIMGENIWCKWTNETNTSVALAASPGFLSESSLKVFMVGGGRREDTYRLGVTIKIIDRSMDASICESSWEYTTGKALAETRCS